MFTKENRERFPKDGVKTFSRMKRVESAPPEIKELRSDFKEQKEVFLERGSRGECSRKEESGGSTLLLEEVEEKYQERIEWSCKGRSGNEYIKVGGNREECFHMGGRRGDGFRRKVREGIVLRLEKVEGSVSGLEESTNGKDERNGSVN